MPERFNIPCFSPAGDERIRLAMARGHRGDDPALPLRRVRLRRLGRHFISWRGPVDLGGIEEALWEMELDFTNFGSGEAGEE